MNSELFLDLNREMVEQNSLWSVKIHQDFVLRLFVQRFLTNLHPFLIYFLTILGLTLFACCISI